MSTQYNVAAHCTCAHEASDLYNTSQGNVEDIVKYFNKRRKKITVKGEK